MTAVPRPAARPIAGHRLWIPRQHGAWAMLVLPVLLGVAASRPSPWQLVVGGAALAAYLASATAQAWTRSRRPPEHRLPIAVYGSIAAVLGAALLVAFPPLALTGLVVVPTAAIVFRGARPGTRRDLANSVAQVAQALVLVPAAAWVSGAWDPTRVLAYVAVAGGYQLGTVLVVRSVLRERGNTGFLALSVAFHVALVAGALLAGLPVAYAVLAGLLGARAVLLPVIARRLAAGSRPLRPVHVGLTEMAASISVVILALAVPI
jgi:hypothetical protein